MKHLITNTTTNHNSMTTAPWNKGTGLIKNFKEEKIARFCIAFVMCVLSIIASANVATAEATVTVSWLGLPTVQFPNGVPLSGTATYSDRCSASTPNNATAPAELIYSGDVGYEFLFWDNQGTIVWPASPAGSSTEAQICPGSTNGQAIAWYMPVCISSADCSGPPCAVTLSCTVTTLAYNLYYHEFRASGDGTPIEGVAPNSPEVWASGGTTVNTSYSAEAITANSSLYGTMTKYGGGEFLYWEQLPKGNPGTPAGLVYNAPKDFYGYAIAFYLTIPPPPPPPHCKGTTCT
jgi:hypothetical protein